MSSDPIIASCEAEWEAWKTDCSGFVKAVAKRHDVYLFGNANQLVDFMQACPEWRSLENDGHLASQLAREGYLVVAGLKKRGHGHVAIIVKSGSISYPVGYWGRLGSVGKKNTGINFSWNKSDLKDVEFFGVKL